MNPILIDTNAYVAFKRGHAQALEILRRAPAIALNPVILGELLSGFAAGEREEANRRGLAEFLSSPRVTVLPVQSETAQKYASIFVALHKAGTPIPTNDMWVAATALQHGLSLFSYDRHFRAIKGLHIGMSVPELEVDG